MSDTYEIDGVKITPAGGGYYDLEHSSLTDPERVQGKEKAETRAKAIAKAAPKDEGGGDIPPEAVTSELGAQNDPNVDQRSPAEQVQERDLGMPDPKPQQQSGEPVEPVDPEEKSKDDKLAAKDEELAAVKAQLAESKARNEELEKAAAKVVTVMEDRDPAVVEPTPAIPTQFSGELDKDGKAALKKAGIGYTRIVLEENENIPPTGLYVAVNGRSYMITPGEEVDVPDFILEVLDNAVMSAPMVDSKTNKVLGYRDRSRYPYRRVNK